MAVVSISRIQVRRGQKNSGSGLPQLASGELGWAIDSQELYIGNGAVSEGAPYVGNTKILSEHDDLFELADTYAYKQTSGNIQTGDSPNNPVYRTLQERLDDKVSIRSFGANGDGTDQTAALQRAIDQLYLNPVNKGVSESRVELVIEPGTYVISSSIYLPPYATLVGAGAEKTIITMTGSGSAFITTNEISTPGNYADDSATTTLNQPRNIKVSGMTINTNGAPAFELRSCKDSKFSDIWIKGNWNILTLEGGSIVSDPADDTNSAILMTARGGATYEGSDDPDQVVTCKDNCFEDIHIFNHSSMVFSDWAITNNLWNHCKFVECDTGFVFGKNTQTGTTGQATGPTKNTISNSTFDDVMRQAIVVYDGPYNKSLGNKFYNVGNLGSTPDDNAYANVQFDDQGCLSSNDYFQRADFLGYDQEYTANSPYTNEVVGDTIVQYDHPHTIQVPTYGVEDTLFRLPAIDAGRGYEIDYLYRSNAYNATRSGKLTLVVDPVNDSYNLTDEYDFTGDGAYQENLEFNARTKKYGGGVGVSVDTVDIVVLNSSASDDATLTYTVKYKS